MLEKKGIPGVVFGVEAFGESAKGAARVEGVPQLRITTIPYNYFGDTRDRVFSEIKDAAPAIMDNLTKPLFDKEKKSGVKKIPDTGESDLSGNS